MTKFSYILSIYQWTDGLLLVSRSALWLVGSFEPANQSAEHVLDAITLVGK